MQRILNRNYVIFMEHSLQFIRILLKLDYNSFISIIDDYTLIISTLTKE